MVYNLDVVKSCVPQGLGVLTDAVLFPAFTNWEVSAAIEKMAADVRAAKDNPQTTLLDVRSHYFVEKCTRWAANTSIQQVLQCNSTWRISPAVWPATLYRLSGLAALGRQSRGLSLSTNLYECCSAGRSSAFCVPGLVWS